MNMDVNLLVEVGRESQLLGARTHVRQRRMRALLHHLTELAGDRQLAASGYDGDLDSQQLAAQFSPCQARGDTDLRFGFRDSVTEFGRPQVFAEAGSREPDVGITIGL